MRGGGSRGSIFVSIFAAVVAVGILGSLIMNYMQGPLRSSVIVTNKNMANTQMVVGAQIAVAAAAAQGNGGDCDGDDFVEPLPWRSKGAGEPDPPQNGGYIPAQIGATKTDPWTRPYGYCVWDHGSAVDDAGCGGPSQNRLRGTANDGQPVVAIISSGPDRVFQTVCNDFADTSPADGIPDLDLVMKPPGSDDLVMFYTYAEATGASSGLWQLKSGAAGVATIGSRDIEVGGNASFSGQVITDSLNSRTGRLDVNDPLLLPDETAFPACTVDLVGAVRRYMGKLEICSVDPPSTYDFKLVGGGASDALATTALCTGPGDAGKVRYDPLSQQPQFCNGVSWQPFVLSSPTASLVVAPASSYTLDVSGPCSGGSCPYAYSGWQTFTVRNQGNTATATLAVPTLSGANATNFEIDAAASTCDNGIALAPSGNAGNTCIIVVRARANGNLSYSAQINVTAGALSAVVPLYGVASSFGCSAGGYGWGGILTANCTGNGGTEPGTGQLILQENGCGCGTLEPACNGNPANDCSLSWVSVNEHMSTVTGAGAQNTANIISYGVSAYAAQYCADLVKGGYDDWFLPSLTELKPSTIDGFASTAFQSVGYWVSDYSAFVANPSVTMVNGNDGTSSTTASTAIRPVRCMRQHNKPAPSAFPDTNPFYKPSSANASETVDLGASYTALLSARMTSSPVTVYGINQPVSFTVSGDGAAALQVNGGAEATSGTINPRDVIQLRMTSPAAAKGQHNMSVQIGTDETPLVWQIRTTDASLVKKMFITSGSWNGNLGGIGGADAKCQATAAAASLPGAATYRAFLSTTTVSARDRPDWATGRFETAGGALIANDITDLTDGSIATALRSETDTVVGLPDYWTGSDATASLYGSTAYSCTNWTVDLVSANLVKFGTTGSISGGVWFTNSSSATCASLMRIPCFGPN